MNSRFFDHRMHAAGSARKMIMALRSAGGDTKGAMADDLTDSIITGIINIALDRQQLEDAKRSEMFNHIMDAAAIRNREVSRESFDDFVNITAEAFKTGNCRNDYQFFWNMLKEAMYCVESDVLENFSVKLDASTITYHISNAAKEAVGAVGLKYSSDQLVF